MRLNNRLVLVVALVIGAAPAPLRAQTYTDASDFLFAPSFDFSQVIQQPAGPPPTPRHTGIKAMLKELVVDVKNLPSRENLMWVGIGSGLALAAHPLDDNVNRKLVGNHTAENVFKPGEILGGVGTLLGSATAVYAVGRLTDAARVSDVGVELGGGVAHTEEVVEERE